MEITCLSQYQRLPLKIAIDVNLTRRGSLDTGYGDFE